MSSNIDDIVPNYDDLTVEKARAKIDERDLDPTDLRTIATYERNHDNRVTLLRSLEAAIEDRPTPSEVTVVPQSQYAGGRWFDDVGEPVRLPFDRRVEQDVDRGRLELVEKHYPEADIETDLQSAGDDEGADNGTVETFPLETEDEAAAKSEGEADADETDGEIDDGDTTDEDEDTTNDEPPADDTG